MLKRKSQKNKTMDTLIEQRFFRVYHDGEIKFAQFTNHFGTLMLSLIDPNVNIPISFQYL